MDVIIFGISGDLAEKKLVPSLITLYRRGKLPTDTHLVGFSRSHKHLDHLELPFRYTHMQGSYGSVNDMKQLRVQLRPDAKQLFYMALPPDAAREALSSLYTAGVVSRDDVPGTRLILLEKPFGTGYEDAQSLISFIDKSFLPGQCLKVDHYAGKEELRRLPVENVQAGQVTFEILETATVENRKGFYDRVGALRDIGQNHLLLMLAMFFRGKGNREEVLALLEIDPDISKYEFGSYEGYDTIETFFSIPAILPGHPGTITLRSGKALSVNRARIALGQGHYIALSPGVVAYENILLDAIDGRHESFLTDGEVLSAWKFIEKVEKIKETVRKRGLFFSYPLGSDADTFL